MAHFLARNARFLSSGIVRRSVVPAVTTATTTPTPSFFSRRNASSFGDSPAPPRLPPEQQAEFEKLLKEAADSLAAAQLADAMEAHNAAARAAEEGKPVDADAVIAAAADKAKAAAADKPTPTDSSNPVEGVWRGAAPEFDGDRNPKTGEIGGPKNEPLRWGSTGDWSFNGRATDF